MKRRSMATSLRHVLNVMVLSVLFTYATFYGLKSSYNHMIMMSFRRKKGHSLLHQITGIALCVLPFVLNSTRNLKDFAAMCRQLLRANVIQAVLSYY